MFMALNYFFLKVTNRVQKHKIGTINIQKYIGENKQNQDKHDIKIKRQKIIKKNPQSKLKSKVHHDKNKVHHNKE